MKGEIFLSTIYLGGLFSFFSPCIFPILPVYISVLSKEGKFCITKTLAFVFGLSISFVLLGFSFGIIGEILTGDLFRKICGVLVVFFGIVELELIDIKALERTKLLTFESKNSKGILSSFLLGFSFSLGWTPCVGPILASILFMSSSSGNTLYSMWILLIYVLGLATPFIIFSIFWKYLREYIKGHDLSKCLLIIKKIGGVLLVIMGLLLYFDKLTILI